MPPLTSAACGRTVCAPTEKKKKRAVNDLWEEESPAASRHPLFDNGGFGRRAFFRSKSCLSREHPHPPPSGAPSPLKGEGCGRPQGSPLRRKRTRSVGSAKPGAAIEPHRRQFLQTQGPVARDEMIKATQILRAGNFCPFKGVTPVMGSGESGLWT